MPTVRLGNVAALDRGRVVDGHQVTTVPFVDSDGLESRLRTLCHADGLWPAVSAAPPAWVSCDDPELEAAIAEQLGCPVGEPDDWS